MEASNAGIVRLGDKNVVIHHEVCSKLVYTQATCGIIITGIILSMENMSKIRHLSCCLYYMNYSWSDGKLFFAAVASWYRGTHGCVDSS